MAAVLVLIVLPLKFLSFAFKSEPVNKLTWLERKWCEFSWKTSHDLAEQTNKNPKDGVNTTSEEAPVKMATKSSCVKSENTLVSGRHGFSQGNM